MGTYHLANWVEVPEARLVGIAEILDGRAERACRRFSCTRYPSLASLLEDIDAVSIATPSSCHAPMALQCKEAGVHALLEKPMCLSGKEAAALVQAFGNGAPVLQVGHIERYNPVFRRLQELLRDEEVVSYWFDRLHSFRSPREPIDVIFDLMIHDLDLLRALEGDFAVEWAEAERIRTDSFDQATAVARWGDGREAHFRASRVSNALRRMIVAKTQEAEYQADLAGGRLSICRRDPSAKEGSRTAHYELPSGNALREQLTDFARSIIQGTPPAVSAVDGMAAVVLAEQVGALAAEAARAPSLSGLSTSCPDS